MGAFILLGLLLWLIIAVAVARLGRWITGGSGVTFWLVLPIIFFLPFADILAGSITARIWLREVPSIRPPSPLSVSGLLVRPGWGDEPSDPSFWLEGDRAMEYLEVDRRERPPSKPSLGPGYYQYRMMTPDDLCTENVDKYYRLGPAAKCYKVDRTNDRVSHYTYQYENDISPPYGWLWSNLTMDCERVTDLDTGLDVARECKVDVSNWLMGRFIQLPLRHRLMKVKKVLLSDSA